MGAIELNLKDMVIISKTPKASEIETVMNVGCANGRLCWHMNQMGYKVISTDYETTEETRQIMESYKDELDYHNTCNIFDLSTYPVESADVVICSEVLEHLPNYKEAFANLLKLTNKKLIITFPHLKSFNPNKPLPYGHCNWWSDDGSLYSNVNEYVEMASPYSITIEKAMTKLKDYNDPLVGNHNHSQRVYLLVIDKTKNQEGSVDIQDISSTQLDWESNAEWNPND